MKFLVLALLFTVAVLHPVPEQANKPDGSHQNAQPHPSPTTVDQAPAARPSPPPEQDGANSKTNEPSWCERIVKPLVDNWPLIGITIWGIIVAIRTVKAIEKQLGEMQAAGKQTDNLIANSTRSIRLEQRAWVQTQEPVTNVPTIEADKTAQMRIYFKNSGRTPAVKVRGYCTVTSLKKGASVYGILERRTQINPIIPSSGRAYIDTEIKISFIEWGAILTGKIDYFIIGTVTYDDIFDVHHSTQFCYIVDPKTGTTRYHDEHNEIDRRE